RQSHYRTRWSHGDVAAQRQGARRRRLWLLQPVRSFERGTLRSSAGLWTATGNLVTARGINTATSLHDGTVLLAGGYDGLGDIADAELYDPATGTWTATGSLGNARA